MQKKVPPTLLADLIYVFMFDLFRNFSAIFITEIMFCLFSCLPAISSRGRPSQLSEPTKWSLVWRRVWVACVRVRGGRWSSRHTGHTVKMEVSHQDGSDHHPTCQSLYFYPESVAVYQHLEASYKGLSRSFKFHIHLSTTLQLKWWHLLTKTSFKCNYLALALNLKFLPQCFYLFENPTLYI